VLGVLIFACGLAAACRARLHDRPPFEGHFPKARDADVERARSANEESVRYYREKEWAFNKGSTEEPPELCLALSGGGMRSAAFSIGVLAGLHDTGVLRKIDVMSSVFGGSWAMG
jgi:predicted acylesterase/phospholipase RssA